VRRFHSSSIQTAYPPKHNLLSTTVIADDTTADAYATAFMVMGLKINWILKKNENLKLRFILFMTKTKNGTYTLKV
jgi:thiamine biosynthesis lipoprotein